MKVILVMFKDGQRREFPLTAEKTVLGRRQDCGLRIPTQDVSRQHCAVLIQGNKLTVKDLGSSNGTYVNGKRVAETKLKAGDKLQVGPVVFVVQVDGQPAKITPADARAMAPAKKPAAPAKGAAGAAAAAPSDDEETLDLSEVELELDDPIDALEDLTDEDEKDMP